MTTRRAFLLAGAGAVLGRDGAGAQTRAGADRLMSLPPDLPIPVDDGACDHLAGLTVPSVKLRSTKDRWVDLSAEPGSRIVVYAYPRTGRPDAPAPEGWNAIPGARGCTPETCGFRDHHQELRKLGAEVFGLSTQDTEYQKEMVARLEVPFEVLSDQKLELTRALRLPTFDFEGTSLIKRLTLVISEKRIEKVFYPIFPPGQHAMEVVLWLRGSG
jgi:peroxiredoxin